MIDQTRKRLIAIANDGIATARLEKTGIANLGQTLGDPCLNAVLPYDSQRTPPVS